VKNVKKWFAAALLVGGCTPKLGSNSPPPAAVVVEFDLSASPPVVPVPNDLALSPTTGLILFPPPSQNQTAAQTEFNNGYLATLAGFPFESSVKVLVSGPLDPSTVTPQSVAVIDLTLAASSPLSALVPGLSPTFDPSANAIDVVNPSGWTRAHHYAVVLVAANGTNPTGLKGARGEPVIGSPTWGLLSSPKPLVNCPIDAAGSPDLTSSSCTLAVDVIPSTQTDPTLRLQDQLKSAEALEPIRQSYALLYENVVRPLLNVDLSRIAIFWTFTIVDAGEVTFDPAHGIVPFPNDVLRSPATGQVSLPNPLTGTPLSASDCLTSSNPQVELYCGLNTLDGFSTIAPPISENGTQTGAAVQASIDSQTLSTQSIGLVALTSAAPLGEQTPAVRFAPCLNCLSSHALDGTPQTSPQELQWQMIAPLDEKTTYVAYVTTDVKDTQGKNVIANPIFALLRLTNPLVDAGGNSQVDILSNSEAQELEPLRAALAPVFTALGSLGVSRQRLALAWTFTTQSEATDLDALVAAVSAAPGPIQSALPQGPLVVADETAQYVAAAAAAGANVSAVGSFYVGIFETPYAVTGPEGTLDLGSPKPEPVHFVMALPATPAGLVPPNGYPVTIFGHGLTRDRNDVLAIANALARAGQVTIAADAPLHGERSSCTGAGPYVAAVLKLTSASDDNACQNPLTMECNEDPLIGRCVGRSRTTPCTGDLACEAARLGLCAADGKCEGGDFLRDVDVGGAGIRPVISGWNIFSLTNFLATRDNFRQDVIDLTELVHTIGLATPQALASQITAGLAAATGGKARLDLTNVNYVGQSLGGILGTLFNAVSPATKEVVLNVPGGDLPSIIELAQTPSFVAANAALQANLAAQGIAQGTPPYDRFLEAAQWILDPADPANMAWRLTHPVTLADGTQSPNVNRNAFIQFIQGDQTIPNASSLALVLAATRPPSPVSGPPFGCEPPLYCYEFTETVDGFNDTNAPADARHGFLLAPPSDTNTPSPQAIALTANAQSQVEAFISTGTVPMAVSQ
jgi:hypothetical protein